MQADGKILLGGEFTRLQPNGAATPTTRKFIARVQADGTIDMGFDPKANERVHSLAVQADGKVLLGGLFTTLQPNGAALPVTRSFIERVYADGTLDMSFHPKANGAVFGLIPQADGKVLVGGRFTTLQPNGSGSPTARQGFARLVIDPASQTLTLSSANQLTWARSGAGP